MCSHSRTPQILVLALVVVSVLFACNTDDDQAVSILPYNSMEHIYGTMSIADGNTYNKYEVVIDPSTGRVDTIPGTRVFGGSFSFPLGTKDLTDFTNNRRIYIDINKQLVIQDLETFENTVVELRDETLGQSIINPQYLRFGPSVEELYLIDTDKSLWQIDLMNNSVMKTTGNLPVVQGAYLSHFFYLSESNDFLYSTNTEAFNAGTVTDLILYDPDQAMIIESINISKSFGFVQHPDDEHSFYFLQMPTAEKGFRLMEMTVNAGNIQIQERSTADLAIDKLSLYMQTIHTATNSYICRGGSSSLEMPTNSIYSIDLSSGELTDEEELEIEGLVLKLAGE